MSSDTLQPRPPYGIPSHEDDGQTLPSDLTRRVYLRHPGYNDTVNILMALPALDSDGGIHHETARIACAIVANNRWEGFFTETRTGDPIQVDADGILRGSNYYFRLSVDRTDEKYPVVPSFAHWRFPHDNLPRSWIDCKLQKIPLDRQLPRQSSLAEATLARDISCRITNHIEGTEHAHLVPRSEERWFSENSMFRYTNQQRPGSEPVDDAQNAILLRSDLHTIFDQKRFAIVPKCSMLLVHIIAPGSSLQLTNLYHNVPLQPLVGVAVQYMLARFAWTIFAQVINFIQQGPRRKLCIYIGEGETSVEEFSGDQCRQISASNSKSRSQSPRKRQRDLPMTTEYHQEEIWEMSDEENRGRTIRRNFGTSLDGSFSRDGSSTSAQQSSETNYDDYDQDDTANPDERTSFKKRCLREESFSGPGVHKYS